MVKHLGNSFVCSNKIPWGHPQSLTQILGERHLVITFQCKLMLKGIPFAAWRKPQACALMHKDSNNTLHTKLILYGAQWRVSLKKFKNSNKMLLPQCDIWSIFSVWKSPPCIQHLSKPMTFCAGEEELRMKRPHLAAFSSCCSWELDHSWNIRNYCYNVSGCDPDEPLKGGLVSGSTRGDQIRLFKFLPLLTSKSP